MSTHAERVNPNITLAVLAVGALAYAVLSAAVIPALPTIQHDLHTSETGVTWLLTAYLLAGNKLIGEGDEMNATTLPKVSMPNRGNFVIRFPDRI